MALLTAKSQFLPTCKRRGSHRGMNTRWWGPPGLPRVCPLHQVKRQHKQNLLHSEQRGLVTLMSGQGSAVPDSSVCESSFWFHSLRASSRSAGVVAHSLL